MENNKTNSEDYAVKFGGVWLEFHERIVVAEETLKTALIERDTARDELAVVQQQKTSLEEKFKNNLASLTKTETNHLEEKQILDKVKEEHKDLSRRCLAAEAHTEWLENQLKQQKSISNIKQNEIEDNNSKLNDLKAQLLSSETMIDELKNSIINKDNEIIKLNTIIKTKNNDITILNHSILSKDKQITLLIKEKNTIKEDNEKMKNTLSILRRKETSIKHKQNIKNNEIINKDNNTQSHTIIDSQLSSMICEDNDTSITGNNHKKNTIPTSTTTTADTSTTAATNTTTAAASNVEKVLRQYKSNMFHKTNKKELPLKHNSNSIHSTSNNSSGKYSNGSFSSSQDSPGYGESVLLEDILDAVINAPKSLPDGDYSSNKEVYITTGTDSNTTTTTTTAIVAATNENSHLPSSIPISPPIHIRHSPNNSSSPISTTSTGIPLPPPIHTPTTTRTSPSSHIHTPINTHSSPSHSPTPLCDYSEFMNTTDFEFIDSILDHSAPSPTPKARKTHKNVHSDTKNKTSILRNSEFISKLNDISLEPNNTINKILFTSTTTTTTTTTNNNKSSSNGVNTTDATNTTNCSAGIASGTSSSTIRSNPWKTKPTTTTSTTATTGNINDIVSENQALLQRERDYKDTIYLLQEEVRLLHSRVANYETSRRVIQSNSTPRHSSSHIRKQK